MAKTASKSPSSDKAPDQQTEVKTETANEPETTAQGQFIIVPLKDDKGKTVYDWVFKTSNGREMATNSVPYKRKNDLTRAIDQLKEQIVGAPVFQLVDDGDD